MNKQLSTGLRNLTDIRIWGHGLFWSWNLIFLAFMFLGFAPQVLPDMILAVQVGDIPSIFLAYATILTMIPLLAVIAGFVWLRHSPWRLLLLGYGVEGPLMLALLFRFFAVGQATPAVNLLLSATALGLATLLWTILDRRIDQRGALLTGLRLVGLTLLLLVGLYASIWLAFYVVPLVVAMLNGLGDFLRAIPEIARDLWGWLRQIEWQDLATIFSLLPFTVLGFTLAIYTATLLVVLPIVVPVLYARAWLRSVRVFIAVSGRPRAIALATSVLAVCVVLVVVTNRQPQQQAFALLETPPATPAEAQALLAREDAIRKGLLNAYLAPQRYLSAVGQVDHVHELYQELMNLKPVSAARVQHLYEGVARPVLYAPVGEFGGNNASWDNPVFREEPLEAAELYESFFDQTINDGEREAVVQAVRSTWMADQARASWMAVDDREIYLAQQEVSVVEQGDWAELELYEVYRNQTQQRQEVVYYFSLPESAVITGIWLGDSPDRDQRFTHRVAPRGAAQATYRNEVQRRVDPALVEQIGPRQYRLRAFPVEPRRWDRDDDGRRSEVIEGPPLHLWMTYRVFAQDATWPLPRLAEKRNVYWDDDSVRLVNGEPMAIAGDVENTWLPPAVSATGDVKPMPHRVDFPSGETVVAMPVAEDEILELTGDVRLALVLDRSYSMAAQEADVLASLSPLNRLAEAGAAVDVYLTASAYRGEEPSRVELADLDVENILYFGGQNAAELLEPE